ncbi:MAG: glutathione S-transferase family protein, partial [Novosphingobium sp.]
MKIFGSLFSPFVRKVYLVAAEKGVAIEAGVGGPGNYTPEFLAVSPFKKMPAMVDGDFSLADSTAICAYLDAKYPDPAVYPADPQQRGKVVWYEEVADTIIPP